MAELLQRSTEWRALRTGDVTASRFQDIKGPRSKSEGYPMNNGERIGLTALRYLEELLAEMITGNPQDMVGNAPPIHHGNFYEEVHREHAERELKERFGQELFLPTGDLAYVSHPTEPNIGGSPDYGAGDGLLVFGAGPNKGGELKCPYNQSKHVSYLRRGVDWWLKEHKDQVMGLMWITGWEGYYVSSFHPGFPPELQMILWEVERDDIYIKRLESRVLAFRDLLFEEFNQLGAF